MKSNVWGKKIKLLTAVLLAIMLLEMIPAAAGARPAPADNKTDLRFYALNVGQGDCLLFIFPDGKTILIDAGPEETGKNVVRYLKNCGVKKIDLLVATHAHSDHIGGMKSVISKFQIGKVWDSGFIHGSQLQKDFYRTIQKKRIPFGRPKRGFSEKMGGAYIEVLAPSMVLRGTRRDVNNNCLVLRITYGHVSFLLTGDMEREERATIAPLPQSTVLKAAHHGSRNGTDKRVLHDVSPNLIILSYGRNNSYGCPHKEVVRAITETTIKRFDTKDGTIRIRTDGNNLTYPNKMEVRVNGNTN